MTKASDNIFPKLIESMNTSDQAAPSDSSWKVYAKANGIFARSSNAVVGPFGAAGAGAVATDTIWDAKGDLAAATGADAAVKVSVGSNSNVLTADSAQSAGIKWGPAPIAAAVTGDGFADVTTVSTTLVDLTGAALTITTAAARKVLVGFSGTAQCSSANGLVSVGLSIDAADVGGTLGFVRQMDGSANVFGGVSFTYMTANLTAASHTFKVRWATSTGTGTMKNASATVVWHFWVMECWS